MVEDQIFHGWALSNESFVGGFDQNFPTLVDF